MPPTRTRTPTPPIYQPQREGGGNNFYGAELARRLGAARGADGGLDASLDDLILMQRIVPPPQPAVLVRRGRAVEAPTLSELGVFGTFLAVDPPGPSDPAGPAPKPTVVLVNEYAGHILRTKAEGVDEGGVATGYAVLSSPILV